MRFFPLQTVIWVLCAGLPAAAQTNAGAPVPTSTGEQVKLSAPAGPLDKLAGLWRLQGTRPNGKAYGGQIAFTKTPQGYRYQRVVHMDESATPIQRLGLGRTVEQGQARLSGTFLHTRQRALPGILSADMFSGKRRSPRRNGFYRLRLDQARGFSIVPTSGERGREALTRRGEHDNHVELYVDGKEYFPALHAAVKSAKLSIHIQTFIYRDDATGRALGNLLIAKAQEGLVVRVLVDGFGAKDLSKDLKRKWKQAGVELIIQHTWGSGIKGSLKNIGKGIWSGLKSLFGKRKQPREKRGIFNHDHRKVIVIDGRQGFIGGMNIATEYEHEWHDVHSGVQGSAVKKLQDLFYDRWRAAGGKGEVPEAAPETEGQEYIPGSMKVDVVEALPGLKTDIKKRYLREINAARREVLIEMAYFADDSIIAALKRQAHRGVNASVILPNDEDHDVKLVRDAFNWVQNDVVRSGVKLFKYPGRMVHTKVATFDGRVATVGSSNLDNMALTKLAEANLFVSHPGFTQVMNKRVFEVDLPISVRVKIEKMSWWKKVKGGVLHFFRSFL